MTLSCKQNPEEVRLKMFCSHLRKKFVVCAQRRSCDVAVPWPLHLCSIISIEAVSSSKWTVWRGYFLASEAGARIMKRIQFHCLPNSSLPISNYWKWKRFCQSGLGCQFGVFKCLYLPWQNTRGIPEHSQFSTWQTRAIPAITCLITGAHLAFSRRLSAAADERQNLSRWQIKTVC